MSKTSLGHSSLLAMVEHPADAMHSSSEEASEEQGTRDTGCLRQMFWLQKCGRAVCPSCLHQKKAKGRSVNGIQEIFNGCLWRQDRS